MTFQNTANPRCWIFLSTLLAILSSPLAATEAPFFEYQARYQVTRGDSAIGYVDARLSRREDGLWHYILESRATAWYVRMLGISTTESVWFDWREDRLVPLTYRHVSGEPGHDRFWQHQYDWDTMRSQTRTHSGNLEIALEDGTLDPLTLRLAAVASMVQQASGAPKPGDPDFVDLAFTVLERDELENQHYRFVRNEAIEVDGRCFDAAVYHRFRKDGSNRNYTAWHARSLGWMPVQISFEDDGKPITLSLSQWELSEQSLQAPRQPSPISLPEPGRCPGNGD
ncbi:MAG: DUF3108 domain-containing protein [Wenzhouxiangellaceae bacterium]|nr:DUF3108 domain-containing protein [Wenzhouxiangellaceae bacterium]